MGQPEKIAPVEAKQFTLASSHPIHPAIWRRRWFRCFVRIIYLLVMLGLLVVFQKYPPPPSATLRIVDAQGLPAEGARVKMFAVRSVSNRVSAYWEAERSKFPIVADKDGLIIFSHPRDTAEGEEVGEIYLEVRRDGLVPLADWVALKQASPATTNAWRQFKYKAVTFWDHLRGNRMVKTLAMQQAATLEVTAEVNGMKMDPRRLIPVMQGVNGNPVKTAWSVVGNEGLRNSQLPVHWKEAFFLAYKSEEGGFYYSGLMTHTPVAGVTNRLDPTLRPGLPVSGKLSDEVPRPVKNGFVHVWSSVAGFYWEAWTIADAEGNFSFESLPFPTLEMAGTCNGYVSANESSSNPSMYRTQSKSLVVQGGKYVLKMIPDASADVLVLDPNGQPLQGATVRCRAVLMYSGGSTLFPGGKWGTVDLLEEGSLKRYTRQREALLSGRTGPNGRAIIKGLPAAKWLFLVEHPDYLMPYDPVTTNKIRGSFEALKSGETVQLTVRMEKKP